MKVYRSKISFGLLTFVFLAFFIPVFPIILTEKPQSGTLGLIALLLVVFGLVLHLFLGTTYTIATDKLIVKCGFIRYPAIEIHSIKEVTSSKSWLASPAPSLDRIRLSYGKANSILLSPRNKHQFVEHLVQINPEIKAQLDHSS
jgi:hypothetical protein